jgi:hypothetical protein
MQRILAKHKKIKIEKMNDKLNTLKTDYIFNSAEICQVENKLNIFLDTDLRERVKDFKILECLNREKITPLLVSLAKKR